MIGVGFVGLGHNGVAHIEAHRRVGRSTVAEELCADPGVDAVSVNTGDPHHVEPFVAAVRAGKHVLTEKPLANTVDQVETMVRAAREARPGLKIAVGYILRFNPVFEAIRELCRSGRLGRIYYLEADYVHNLLYQARRTDPFTGRNWYLEEERPMVRGGSHSLDLLRWCSGLEVESVCGYSSHVAFPAMKEDDCQVALFQLTQSAVEAMAAGTHLRVPCYSLD